MWLIRILIILLSTIITISEGYTVGKTTSKKMKLVKIMLTDIEPFTTLPCQLATCNSASRILCIVESYNQSAFLVGYNKSHLISCFIDKVFDDFSLADFDGALYRRYGKFLQGRPGADKRNSPVKIWRNNQQTYKRTADVIK